jgi:CYTH domain-containing protein
MSTIRRFLIASSLGRLVRKERGASRVTEGYFPHQPGRSSHVQVEGGTCNLILITSSGGGLPTEERTEVPRAHADALLDVAPGKVVYDRARLNLAGREIFVDRFSVPGPLDVLSVVFEDEDTARSFRAPPWFGPEVTSEQAYQNRSIALEGAPTPPDVPLSNAGLESLLDMFENRFASSSPARRPQPNGWTPAAPSGDAPARPIAVPFGEGNAPSSSRPTNGGQPAPQESAADTSNENDAIEDDVIRELARALGR